MKSQKQVWDNIAKEWFEFKTRPTEHTIEFLKNKTGKVLDLGSGAGRHLIKIKNQKMYLVDFSKGMIKFAKQKAKKQNIDAEFFVSELTKLPFKNNFFDSAICTHALYCIENPEEREQAVKELYRVLKPNSKILISVWNRNSKRFKNSPSEKYVKWKDKGERYYYLYGEKEIHDLFEKVGFKIINKIPSYVNITFIAKK